MPEHVCVHVEARGGTQALSLLLAIVSTEPLMDLAKLPLMDLAKST